MDCVIAKKQPCKTHTLRTADQMIAKLYSVSTLFNNNKIVYAASYYVEVNHLPDLNYYGQFN